MARPALIFCLLLWTTAVVRSESPTALLVDGKPQPGQLVTVDPAWNLTFESPAGKHSLPAADLVQWGALSSTLKGSQILLAGGGQIAADISSIDKDSLLADSDTFGKVKLPLELVSGVIVRMPFTQTARDQLFERLTGNEGSQAKTDRLLLDNGDELNGSLIALSRGTFDFDSGGGRVKLSETKVVAIAFNPSLAAVPRFEGLHAVVGFKEGSRVIAQQIALDTKQCRLTLGGGVEVIANPTDVVALLPLGGRTHYLSDLKSESFKHLPYLSIAWPLVTDRNVLGTPLRAAGQLYLKGLGLHSAAQLVYALDQPYRRFETEVAIDDQTVGRGSVTLRVQVDDGAGGWRTKFESPVVRGGAAPLLVSVEIVGAKKLQLSIDYADQGDELDHVDLLGARLLK